jgi:MFS family permease
MLLMSGLFALFQQRAPRELQARTASVWGAAVGGGYAVGLVLLGGFGDRYGLRAAGVLASLTFLGLALTLGRAVRTALAQPHLEPAPPIPPLVRA